MKIKNVGFQLTKYDHIRQKYAAGKSKPQQELQI
jgi:hypothetical protein